MGTTFVEIDGEKGFWMRDHVLQLWLRLVSLHLDPACADDSSETDKIRQIRDQWLLVSRGGFDGCVPHDLGDAVSTDTGRKVVIQAIDSLQAMLRKASEHLDANTINLLGFDEPIGYDFETKRLLDVSQAFVALIEGKINYTAADVKLFMPGRSENQL